MLQQKQPTKKSKAQRQRQLVVSARQGGFFSVLPPRARVKMAYSLTEVPSGHGTLNLLGAAIDYQINSTFAPGGGAGAHQPYMRDTFFAQYNKYKVHAVHVRLTVPPQTNGVMSYLVTQVAPPNVTVTSNGVAIGPVRERNGGGAYPPTFDVLSTSHATERRLNINMATACGLSQKEFDGDVDTYAASAGSDPTNKVHLLVNMASSSSTTFTTYMQTYMEFDVEWFERLIVSTS